MLKRWYKAVTPLLKHYYGTGGDLNVDEILVITIRRIVVYPQEGVFNGHYQYRNAKNKSIGQLRQGVLKTIENEKYSPDVKKNT